MKYLRTDKKATYNKWAFIVLIILIVLTIISSLVITGVNTLFENLDTFIRVLNSIGFTINILIIVGIILLILSIIKKEKKTSIFYVNIVGYILLVAQTIYLIIEYLQ